MNAIEVHNRTLPTEIVRLIQCQVQCASTHIKNPLKISMCDLWS